MKRTKPEYTIPELLEQYGSMTIRELADKLGVTTTVTHNRMRHFRRLKIVRIEAYMRAPRLQAVYTLGSEPDVRRPKPPSHKERSRRWRENASKRVNSVFQLAVPLHKRKMKGANPCSEQTT